MHGRHIKNFLNSLKCPVCQGQIDIVSNKKSQYNFGCSNNYLHFTFFINDRSTATYDQDGEIINPMIEQERVIVDRDSFRYEIIQNYICLTPDEIDTIIYVNKIDAEGNVIDYDGKFPIHKTFSCNQILFDFQNVTKDKIINRIKTILTFQ